MPQSDGFHGTISVRGRKRPYLEIRRIGGRRYYLLEQMGGGPFRKRYRAFDPCRGAGGDFFLVQRFPAHEWSGQRFDVLRRLKHDGFPRVWECQQHGSNIDVVLTWVEGISLAEYFANIRAARRPQLDPAHALRLMHGLAAAIGTLHHKLQIGHGDIQPSNIIVTHHASRLILIDFGSAWTLQQAAFREEGDGHHRAYAAPELHTSGSAAGFAADQFSASVVLYELLTMQLPYGGLGGQAGRPEFISRAPESFVSPTKSSLACRQLPRSLGALVDRVVGRGLALDPNERYPDRHAWLNDLFEVAARLRLPPSMSHSEKLLMRIARRFVKRPRDT